MSSSLSTLRGRPSENVYTQKGLEELKAFKKRVIISLSQEKIDKKTYNEIMVCLDKIFVLLK